MTEAIVAYMQSNNTKAIMALAEFLLPNELACYPLIAKKLHVSDCDTVNAFFRGIERFMKLHDLVCQLENNRNSEEMPTMDARLINTFVKEVADERDNLLGLYLGGIGTIYQFKKKY